MTLLWNNLDIAFLCHKQNLTTVLFTSVWVHVCKKEGREDMRKKTELFSVVDG